MHGGQVFPDFCAVKSDLQERDLSDFRRQHAILKIFLSVDTPGCAQSVRFFNQETISLENPATINPSLDLSLAFQRFMEKEGLSHILSQPLFRTPEFGKQIGLKIENGVLQGVLARGCLSWIPPAGCCTVNWLKIYPQTPDTIRPLRSLSRDRERNRESGFVMCVIDTPVSFTGGV